MNQVLSMFGSAGPDAFSKMACQMAPYFSTINPLITELRQDAATVQVPFCREITNHLGTVHAIALCNMAELAGGMVTEVSLPDSMRWIPKGMTVEYVKKAVGTMRAIATPALAPREAETGYDLPFDVVVENTAGEAVFRATIAMWITPRD